MTGRDHGRVGASSLPRRRADVYLEQYSRDLPRNAAVDVADLATELEYGFRDEFAMPLTANKERLTCQTPKESRQFQSASKEVAHTALSPGVCSMNCWTWSRNAN